MAAQGADAGSEAARGLGGLKMVGAQPSAIDLHGGAERPFGVCEGSALKLLRALRRRPDRRGKFGLLRGRHCGDPLECANAEGGVSRLPVPCPPKAGQHRGGLACDGHGGGEITRSLQSVDLFVEVVDSLGLAPGWPPRIRGRWHRRR